MTYRPLLVLVLIASACMGCASMRAGEAPATDAGPPRLLILTDIGGDPDDQQSMRRLMLYSNEFEIVGLVASASGTPGELGEARVRPDLINEIIDDYAAAYPNLRRHAEGYPAPEALRAVIRSGNPERGVQAVGEGHDTEGSDYVIAAVDAASAGRPVHVAIWGGATDLAQALYRVRADRSGEAGAAFLRKLRVYAIGDQDGYNTIVDGRRQDVEGTGAWIKRHFPNLVYLETNPPDIDRYTALFRGMYQNDSAGGGHPVEPLVSDAVAALNDEGWLRAHVLGGHGPLGADYPLVNQNPSTDRNTRGVKEGDTPSWFYLLPNGLSDPAEPTWGGWGGRFQHRAGGHYTDAMDEHPSGSDDLGVRRKWTVARWREAYQRDFAARMDWAVREPAGANHPPVAIVQADSTQRVLRLPATAGDAITLSAAGSTDPNGDALGYRWWIYREPSTLGEPARLDGAETAEATVHLPPDATGTLHVILEVTDAGEPALTSYRRVVVRVQAGDGDAG